LVISRLNLQLPVSNFLPGKKPTLKDGHAVATTASPVHASTFRQFRSSVGWGRRHTQKASRRPCRAIEIVAPTGQLYATGRTHLIVTARATQKVSAPHSTVEKSALPVMPILGAEKVMRSLPPRDAEQAFPFVVRWNFVHERRTTQNSLQDSGFTG
jgi:hypothetical protein